MKTSELRKVVERPEPGTLEGYFAVQIIGLRKALAVAARALDSAGSKQTASAIRTILDEHDE